MASDVWHVGIAQEYWIEVEVDACNQVEELVEANTFRVDFHLCWPPDLEPSQRACLKAMQKSRIVTLRFGTGRQKIALERCTTPTLSRRTCRSRYGLPSWRRKSAGGAKRPRELVSHPESRILKPCSSDSQLHIAVCSSRPSTRPTSPQLTRVSGATVCSHDPRRQPHLTAASRIHHPGGCARLQPRRHFQLQLG